MISACQVGNQTDLCSDAVIVSVLPAQEEKGTTEDETAGWHHGEKQKFNKMYASPVYMRHT